jgi:hypothetical protein
MRILGFDIVKVKELEIQRVNEYRILMRDIRKALTAVDGHVHSIRTSVRNLKLDGDTVEELQQTIEHNGEFATGIGKDTTDIMDLMLTLCELMKALTENGVVTPHVILSATKVMENIHEKNAELIRALNEYGNSSMALYSFTEAPEQMVQVGVIQMTMGGCAKSMSKVKALGEILKHEVAKLHACFIDENVISAKSPHEIVKLMKINQKKPKFHKKVYSIEIYKEDKFPWEKKLSDEKEKEGKESNG